MTRWPKLIAVLCALVMAGAAPQGQDYPSVKPGVQLTFPRDNGAHPAFRTEWWYVTGWLRTAGGRNLGFQITFFRTRPPGAADNPSAFAPRQIIFAHAGLSDPAIGRLLHDQRVARQGFGLAEASTRDADLVLGDWMFRRGGDGRYRTRAAGRDFTLDLTLQPTQAILPQGAGGYSRKGPRPDQASAYFSAPHLAVTGTVERSGRREAVSGEAWLDREWSSTLMDPAAVGWDWVGLNLDDGGAVMAFRMRDKAGRALWAGGTLRDSRGVVSSFGPEGVAFSTDRTWRSTRTGAAYPVAQTLTLRGQGGPRQWRLTPLFADQELDSRLAGGPVYWEGAVSTAGGRGYLELTGYLSPLKL